MADDLWGDTVYGKRKRGQGARKMSPEYRFQADLSGSQDDEAAYPGLVEVNDRGEFKPIQECSVEEIRWSIAHEVDGWRRVALRRWLRLMQPDKEN